MQKLELDLTVFNNLVSIFDYMAENYGIRGFETFVSISTYRRKLDCFLLASNPETKEEDIKDPNYESLKVINFNDLQNLVNILNYFIENNSIKGWETFAKIIETKQQLETAVKQIEQQQETSNTESTETEETEETEVEEVK